VIGGRGGGEGGGVDFGEVAYGVFLAGAKAEDDGEEKGGQEEFHEKDERLSV
jgi:hypothetical protein